MFDTVACSLDLGLPDPGACTDADLIAAMTEAGRRESMAAERKLAYAAELAARRTAADIAAEIAVSRAGRGTAAEVAFALTVGRGAAEAVLALGCDLATRLGATRAALACGDIDLTRARIVSERTRDVAEDITDAVQHAILRRIIGRNAGQSARISDQIIARLDPDALRVRRATGEDHRAVGVTPTADGLAELWGRLRAADGISLDTRLHTMALGVCGDDPRTVAQRRADALIALVHGHTDLPCTCGHPVHDPDHTPEDTEDTHPAGSDTNPGTAGGGRTPGPATTPPRPPSTVLVRVIIDAATLLGLTDNPGHLDGYGAIDPDLARRLATDATWQAVLTEARDAYAAHTVPTHIGPRRTAGCVAGDSPPPPVTGLSAAQLDARFAHQQHRRHPDPALRALIQLRDRTCRHPGCLVPAAGCDIDHTRPHSDGGPTLPSNLACLCRYHHGLKTRGQWHWTQAAFGALTATTPTGHTHTSHPPATEDWHHHHAEQAEQARYDRLARHGWTPGRPHDDPPPQHPAWDRLNDPPPDPHAPVLLPTPTPAATIPLRGNTAPEEAPPF